MSKNQWIKFYCEKSNHKLQKYQSLKSSKQICIFFVLFHFFLVRVSLVGCSLIFVDFATI